MQLQPIQHLNFAKVAITIQRFLINSISHQSKKKIINQSTCINFQIVYQQIVNHLNIYTNCYMYYYETNDKTSKRISSNVLATWCVNQSRIAHKNTKLKIGKKYPHNNYKIQLTQKQHENQVTQEIFQQHTGQKHNKTNCLIHEVQTCNMKNIVAKQFNKQSYKIQYKTKYEQRIWPSHLLYTQAITKMNVYKCGCIKSNMALICNSHIIRLVNHQLL
eukprot:TRINITY_DN45108_c0_g1_i1.p1 TRINITY_DN45108_c0_g1~~TRINITY_DN45108_c0_g1_i1.p1  ORF type:complete len:218 (+),score=-23.62 TRINITY_DN45108_c0_g1_i1:109-762(+)